MSLGSLGASSPGFSSRAYAAEEAGEVVSVEGVVFIRPDGRQSVTALKPAKAGDKILSGDVVNTSSNGRIKLLLKDKSIVDLGASALFKVDQFAAKQGTDRQIDVSMMYGTMRAAVTQKITGAGRFKVRTPTATMGVRGTEFVVKSEVKNLDEVRHVIKNPEKPLPPAATAAKASPGAPAPAPIAKTEITVIQGQVDVAKKEAPAADRKPGSAAPAAEKVVSLTAGMQLATKQGDAQLAKPVTLDAKQIAAVASVAKVQDNTFQKAVQIDIGSGGPGGGQIGGMTASMGDVARDIAKGLPDPAAAPIKPSDFVSGGGELHPSQIPFNPQGGLRRLRVIVVTQ